jgi:hypothetical protein
VDYTDEEYFGEMKLMFQTQGWAMLQNELEQNASVINNISATKDERELDFRRGQLAVLGFLISLEEQIERAESDAEAELETP